MTARAGPLGYDSEGPATTDQRPNQPSLTTIAVRATWTLDRAVNRVGIWVDWLVAVTGCLAAAAIRWDLHRRGES
jgi:hypothetical protein